MNQTTPFHQLDPWQRTLMTQQAFRLAGRFPDVVCELLTPLEARGCLPPQEAYRTSGGLAALFRMPPEDAPGASGNPPTPQDLLEARLYKAGMATLNAGKPLTLDTIWQYTENPAVSPRQLKRELEFSPGLWMRVKCRVRTDWKAKSPL
jgi:hypothetical protein